MQTIETQTAETAVTSETVAPAANVSKPARKQANKQAAAKRVAAKPAALVTPAKPTGEQRAEQARINADNSALARQAAYAAIGAFYPGNSKPFKSAGDRFSDINPTNAKAASMRQAGLLLAMLTYGGANIKRDGTFVRGGFIVPARLVNASAKPGDTIRAQPESGCLGNMLGRVVTYISGPTSGKQQADAVYKLDIKRALAEIQAFHGDKAAKAAEACLAHNAKRAAAEAA